MKRNTKRISLSKAFLITAITSFIASPSIHAWTISVLNPSDIIGESGNILLNGNNTSIFKGYLESTGSNLTSGSLGSYNFGADAVIINLTEQKKIYTENEVLVIKRLLNSNTRMLLFGEHNSWSLVNQQWASILGGDYLEAVDSTQSISSNLFPEITDGVSNILFGSPGALSPHEGKGISLTNLNSISLWGVNNNALLFMDINILNNDYANRAGTDNGKLTENVAWWLAGGKSEIPEPSSFALFTGISILGFISLRRRRK